MRTNKQKAYAQNFLAKAHLAARLVNESSVNPCDIVYEIGPGKGLLTKKLAMRAKKVIAIEKDRSLYVKLTKKFFGYRSVILHNTDFPKFKIREPHYKVFANIPFNITAAIIRKLLFGANPPIEAYLVIQKEAAEKFTGATKTTEFSVLAKPWFMLTIVKSLKRTDFSPVPSVDVVLMHIEKRNTCMIPASESLLYTKFVKCGFGAWRKDLKANFRKCFTHRQWKRLSHDLTFPIHAKPSELKFEQWLHLYEFFNKLNISRFDDLAGLR
jgi:23S rRNA (adenine-N6)-dimethyltransferase